MSPRFGGIRLVCFPLSAQGTSDTFQGFPLLSISILGGLRTGLVASVEQVAVRIIRRGLVEEFTPS